MNRVLVVDDDHLVADTLAMIFSLKGFASRAAYSTDEVLACAREFRPELLVCDINMPERDGIELIIEMKRTMPECRMLVLTGYTRSLDRLEEQENLQLAPIAVLTKPCPPAKLLLEAGAILNASTMR